MRPCTATCLMVGMMLVGIAMHKAFSSTEQATVTMVCAIACFILAPICEADSRARRAEEHQ